MSYVYIRSEPGLWTVGFHGPDGKWTPESDHSDREEAAERVSWLNGDAGPLLLALADGIDERLDDENADRQAIAEETAALLRKLAGGERP